jgi:hypothetical protein
MVELMTSNAIIPTKSCQSGGSPCNMLQETLRQENLKTKKKHNQIYDYSLSIPQ